MFIDYQLPVIPRWIIGLSVILKLLIALGLLYGLLNFVSAVYWYLKKDNKTYRRRVKLAASGLVFTGLMFLLASFLSYLLFNKSGLLYEQPVDWLR